MKFSDDRAQWLLLSAVIVSIGLGALVLLLNNAILSGHSATQAITTFPKEELRDLRSNSINEALLLGQAINAGEGNGDTKLMYFDQNYSKYESEMYTTSLLHGGLIDITASPYAEKIKGRWVITTVSLDIRYTDSNTAYSENVNLGIQG